MRILSILAPFSPPLSGMCAVLTLVVKSQAQRTEAVDGSNERLNHGDKELNTLLQKYSSAH